MHNRFHWQVITLIGLLVIDDAEWLCSRGTAYHVRTLYLHALSVHCFLPIAEVS